MTDHAEQVLFKLCEEYYHRLELNIPPEQACLFHVSFPNLSPVSSELLDNRSLKHTSSKSSFLLTGSGISLHASLQKRNNRNADQKRDKLNQDAQRVIYRKQDRRDKWLVGLASAAFGSVLTLIIEHFNVILVIFSNL